MLRDRQLPAPPARFSAFLTVPSFVHCTLLFTMGRKVPNITLRTILIITIALRFLSGTPNHSFLFSLSFFPCDTEHAEQLEGALGQIREQWGQL
jgi:hypothetical protein